MTTFKPGDKVRLVPDCFKRPEWLALDRPQRKKTYGLVGLNLIVSNICNKKIDHVHVRSVDTYDFICIPAALFEPSEPTKTQRQAVQAIADAVEQMVFDRATYLKDMGGHFTGFKWPLEADGKTVTFERGEQFGKCGIYDINRSWCRPLAPAKRVYTPEQIAEARDVSYRIMTEHTSIHAVKTTCLKTGFLDEKDKCNKGKRHTVAIYLTAQLTRNHEWLEEHRAVSFCAPDDTWNDDIGIMVALCKLTGTKMPDWVKGGK